MRKHRPNTLVIRVAILANAGIVALEFAVPGFSGSSPKLSEDIEWRP
jgi:hypothetical protein